MQDSTTQIPHFIVFPFLLSICSISFLLSSFQLPQDTSTIQKKMEWFKSRQMLDSFITYQRLLIDILEQEENEILLKASGAKFFKTILEIPAFPLEQKWSLLNEIPIAKAWNYAYKSRLHIESGARDSAIFYLKLLESTPESRSAKIYLYGGWAGTFASVDNDFKTASTYLNKAERLIAAPADSLLLYTNQVITYQAMGDFEQAIFAQEAILRQELNKKYIDSVALALIYDNLAMIYLEQLNYEAAKKYAGEAINYMTDRSSHLEEAARMWYHLATCYFHSKNKPLETILYLRKVFYLLGLKNESTSTSKKTFVDACNMMALQFLDVNKIDSAQAYVAAAQIAQKKINYKLGEIWCLQAKINAQSNQFTSAEMNFKKAIAYAEKVYGIKSPITANQLVELGKYYGIQKKYTAAKKVLDRALWALSTAVTKKELPDIHTIFSKLEVIKIITLKIESMLALYEKSRYNVSLKDIYKHAIYNLKLLEQIEIEHTFEHSFLDFSIYVYEQAIEACELLHRHHQEKRYLKEAFQFAETAKIMLLQKMIEEPKEQTFGEVSPELIQNQLRLQEQIAWCRKSCWKAQLNKDSMQINWYQKRILSLEEKVLAVKKLFATDYSTYYNFKYNSKASSLDSIQEALNDSTILVQYLEGKRSIYQFIIHKDTFVVRKIFWRTYKSTILKYYKHFTYSKLKQHAQSGGYKDFCVTSYELYHKLLHHELLKKGKRLIIIPDGLLNYIPFGTLLTDIPLDHVHEINFPKLAYLLQDKCINYNYSSSLWLYGMKQNKEAINNDILGMVAAYTNDEVDAFRPKRLQRIRAALSTQKDRGAEMDSLSQKYAGTFYNNRYATEYYLKSYASDYGILHLGTYGWIDPEHPEYSSLVLSEDNYEKEDNFLTINEIKRLELHASMVVLSNCQTGYGSYERGEGIISLGRSFMYAGSPSVILSLWEQSAIHSSIIMDYFYENLKQKMHKDEALRQAKLRYLRSTRGRDAHPTYWAGYISIGSHEPIEVSEPVTYIWWFVIPIAFLGFLGWWSMQALRQRK